MEQRRFLWEASRSKHFEVRYYILLIIALQRYDMSDEVRKRIEEFMSDREPLVTATAKFCYLLWDFSQLWEVDANLDELRYLTPSLQAAVISLEIAFRTKEVAKHWPPVSTPERAKEMEKWESYFRQGLANYRFEWLREAGNVLAQYKASSLKEQREITPPK